MDIRKDQVIQLVDLLTGLFCTSLGAYIAFHVIKRVRVGVFDFYGTPVLRDEHRGIFWGMICLASVGSFFVLLSGIEKLADAFAGNG